MLMDLRVYSHRICFEHITHCGLELNKRSVGNHRVTCFMQCYHYCLSHGSILGHITVSKKNRVLITAPIQRDRGKPIIGNSPNKLISDGMSCYAGSSTTDICPGSGMIPEY